MSENLTITLQIVNIVLTALSPIIISTAYCIRRISKSKCFNRVIEVDLFRTDSINKLNEREENKCDNN